MLLTTTLVSEAGLAIGNGRSDLTIVDRAISSDGRFVAFRSDASNLVGGDTNGFDDIFVKDLETGRATRVSTDSTDTQADSESYAPSISGDGRYVAFVSVASNLVAGDSNGSADIFVKDLETGTTTLVSTDSDGIHGDSASHNPSISDDGRYVAFRSTATNLVAGDTNDTWDVFVKDLETGSTTRVSTDSDETQGDLSSYFPSISSDGRFVAFMSNATNLVTGDTNGTSDIFVKNLETGNTNRVSTDSNATQAASSSDYPSISSDGRYVAFMSDATNLVAGDNNDEWDVFVKDLVTGDTTLVSTDSDETQGDSSSRHPSISGDGHYVAFMSNATNLVVGDTNNFADVFVKDLVTGNTTRVSADSDSTQGNSKSDNPSMSGDGRYVTFLSDATNLIPDDSNGLRDVFVAELELDSLEDSRLLATRLVSEGSAGIGNGGSRLTGVDRAISADGRYVAFYSYASNLVAGDTNGEWDVFVKDLETGNTTLVSADANGTQGNDYSGAPSISADGRYVAFISYATNLVTGDTNGTSDVFVKDLVTGDTTLVSTDSDETQGDLWSYSPSISSDGRFVAFTSYATNLVTGDTNGTSDVFVKDLVTGDTTLVSTDSDETQGNSQSFAPSISADGRHVAFVSIATNLVAGDTNGTWDLFVKDLETGSTTLVSTDSNGTQGNGLSNTPSISADGRYVAFKSGASNLVPGDTNNRTDDIFVRDLETGRIRLVSTDSNGTQGNASSSIPSISADGRYVAFHSYASNLVAGDTNGNTDIFVKDLETGNTTLVSADANGNQANSYSYTPSISADGRYVTFSSDATNLVAGDTNGTTDVFVVETGHHTNATPISLQLSHSDVTENSPSGTAVGTLSTVDPDVGDSFTYGFTAGTGDEDNSTFQIVGNELRMNVSPDFETKSSYSVRIRTTDQGGLFYEQPLTIEVTNVNETPLANIDSAIMTENAVETIDVLANDTDVDDGDAPASFSLDSVTIISTTGLVGSPGAAGTVMIVDGRLLEFDPQTDFDELAMGDEATVVIEYVMSDDEGLTSTSTATITVTGENDTATINGVASNSTDEDSTDPVIGSLAVSDVDRDESIFLAQEDAGMYGQFSIAENGNWTYTLDNDAVQHLRAEVSVSEQFFISSLDGTANETIEITIDGRNDVAVISGDPTGVTVEDSTVNAAGALSIIDDDDFESEFAPQTQTAGTYGLFSIDGVGSWEYELDNDAVQFLADGATLTDSFVVNSLDATATETITVTITGENDVPVAPDVFWPTAEDAAIEISDLADVSTDVDIPDNLTVAAVDLDTYGTLGQVSLDSSGVVHYDPSNAFDYLGDGDLIDDTFGYAVIDSLGAMATGTVVVNVSGVNDAPVAVDDVYTTDEDTPLLVNFDMGTGLLDNDTDVDQMDILSVVPQTFDDPGELVLSDDSYIDEHGLFYFDFQDYFQHLPQGASEQYQLTYDVVDSIGESSTGNIFVNVTGINDAASIDGQNFGMANEEDSTPVTGSLGVLDPDDGESIFLVQENMGGQVGVFSIDENGAWSYTLDSEAVQKLNAGDIEKESFLVSSIDGTATETIEITIQGENDAATISGELTADVVEDSAVEAGGSLSIVDVDEMEASFVLQPDTAGDFGAFSIQEDGTWIYRLDNLAVQYLADGENLTDSFVVDSFDGTASETVTVTITGENDDAVISDGGLHITNEDETESLVGIITVTDVDTDQAKVLDPGETVGTYGTFSIDEVGAWTYVLDNAAVQSLNENDSETESFTVSSVDGSASTTVQITIEGRNDAATISGVPVGMTLEDSPVDVTGVLSIVDVDELEAEFILQTETVGNYGQFSIDPSGSWTYRLVNTSVQYLSEGESVMDSFEVESFDLTATETVTVTITGENDVAAIAGNLFAEVLEDSAIDASGALTVVDADDSEDSFVLQADTPGAFGAFSIQEDGTWNYRLDNLAVQHLAEGAEVTDDFEVESFDTTATALLTVTITGENDEASITEGGIHVTNEDANEAMTGIVTLTDADDQQAKILAPGETTGAYGIFSIDEVGAWSYQVNNEAAQSLNAGDEEIQTFEISSLDGTATTSVQIIIEGRNDVAAISGATTGVTTEDSTTTEGLLSIADADEMEDSFVLQTDTQGEYGFFSIQENGSWSYRVDNTVVQQLTAGEQVTDSFEVRSFDDTASETVTVTITGENDEATISGVLSATMNEDEVSAEGIASVEDLDNAEDRFVTQENVPGGFGAFSIDENGSWNYLLDQAVSQSLRSGETVEDSFSIESVDSTAIQNVVISIVGENDAPTDLTIELAETTITENGLAELTGSFSDADLGDIHEVVITWGDGETSNAIVDEDTQRFTAPHRYLDDVNDLEITATISDAEGANAETSANITVENASPAVDPLTLDATVIVENGIVTLAGSFTDVGTLDAHKLGVNWGDGSSPTFVNLPVGDNTFSVSHQYLDDSPTATSSDSYTITATVDDFDGGRGQASTTVTVQNAVPSEAILLLTDAVIDENGVATVNGQFEDAGLFDTHNVEINWGDGVTESVAVTGVTSLSDSEFELSDWSFDSIEYGGGGSATVSQSAAMTRRIDIQLNDPPANGFSQVAGFSSFGDSIDLAGISGIAAVEFEFDAVDVSDDAADEFTIKPAIRQNGQWFTARPIGFESNGRLRRFVADDFSLEGSPGVRPDLSSVGSPIELGFSVQALVSDSSGNAARTFAVEADNWEATAYSASSTKTFIASHQYLDDNPTDTASDEYEITATISDDDLGEVQTSVVLTVNNVRPVVTVGENITIEDGQPVTIGGSFTDIGSLDSHTIEWNLGDGTIVTDILNVEHTYGQSGEYEVSLTVTDDDGGVDTESLTVTVENVDPVVTVDEEDVSVDEGDIASNSGTFSGGINDSLELSADVGTVEIDSAGVWTWTFATSNGPIESGTVTISATDANGNQGAVTFELAVANVAPELLDVQNSTTSDNPASLNGSVVVKNVGNADAAYHNSYGYFIKDENGNPTTGMVIWSDVQQTVGQNFVVADVDPDVLGAFIIPNGQTLNSGLVDSTAVSFQTDANGDWQAIAPDGQPLVGEGENVFFNDRQLNADNRHHAKDGFAIGNQNWEDQTYRGFADFNDVNMDISRAGTVTLQGAISDPGSDDTHSVTIEWGDGDQTTLAADDPRIDASGAFSVRHDYLTGGVYSQTVTVTDSDGASATSRSKAFVTGVRLKPNGDLQIVGSSENDNISVNLQRGWFGSDDELIVTTTNASGPMSEAFAPESVQRIVVYAADGNDVVNVNSNVSIPTVLYGGSGNDTIRGGSESDTLVGGTGDDNLYGQNGNDLLLGGLGADRLFGGNGRDFLVGGKGSDILDGGKDDDLLLGDGVSLNKRALLDIVQQWSTESSYQSRVDAVTDLLNLDDNLQADSESDSLRGRQGLDLFFANLGDGGDTVKDRRGSEQIVDVSGN